jgi:hypothetical protein
MLPELEEKIFKKYPKLFPEKDRDSNTKNSLMCFGFECDDGWYHIIDSLCYNIQSYIDYKIDGLEEEDLEHFQVTVEQVKEKYGSLRFYVNNGDEYIEGMIRMAESISALTCEYCGSKADMITKGWTKNICFKCNDKNKQKE